MRGCSRSTTDWRRARARAAGALAALLGAALLLGCADEQPPAAGAAESPPAAAAGDPSAAAADSPDAAPAADGETAALPAAARASARHLLYPRGKRVMPQDYTIGPLQDLIAPEEPAGAVTAALVTFLRALAEGEIAAEAVAPDRLRSLRRSLQYHLDAGAVPRAARIGAVTAAEREAHAAIRLFGEPGRVAGEIYLEAGAGGWQVVDAQLDLSRLALPYSPREREFAPRSDRPLLLR